jgi:hypothetical protein
MINPSGDEGGMIMANEKCIVNMQMWFCRVALVCDLGRAKTVEECSMRSAERQTQRPAASLQRALPGGTDDRSVDQRAIGL